MQYIIMDLEWNQPYYKGGLVKKPIVLTGEIIQIGAVKLDQEKNYVEHFECVVTPVHYTKMHRKVKALTGIDEGMLQRGEPFPRAYARFREWCGENPVLFTWGCDDIPILQANMALHRMETERAELPPWYDLQLIFGQQVSGDNRQWSLDAAMEQQGMEHKLQAHNALFDAAETARICRMLDLPAGMQEADRVQKERELRRQQRENQKKKNRAKYKTQKVEQVCIQRSVFEGYADSKEPVQDAAVCALPCPRCGEEICVNKWVRQDKDKWIALTSCPQDGEFFVRLRVRNKEEGVKASRMVYELSPEIRKFYDCKRRGRASGRRRQRKKTAAQS